MAVAAGVSSGGGSGPLAASVSFPGSSFSVSGASGDLFTQGGKLISTSVSGGTAPYVATLTLQGDPSSKLSVIEAPGDPFHRTTIAWAGFSVSELEGCFLNYHVTDNVGASVTVRYPASGSLVIQRTS